MTGEFKETLQRLRQVRQLGPGMTFADLMNSFRDIGSELEKTWPWVPFSTTGNVMCTVFPTSPEDGFEMIIVRTFEPERFPEDERFTYRISGVTQHVKAIQGSVTIEREGYTQLATINKPITIESGERTALRYSKGLFLFRQSPRIADPHDFTFEKLD